MKLFIINMSSIVVRSLSFFTEDDNTNMQKALGSSSIFIVGERYSRMKAWCEQRPALKGHGLWG